MTLTVAEPPELPPTSLDIEVAHRDVPGLSSTTQLTREPMVLDELTALHGVASYSLPTQSNPWLMLGLVDGSWIKVMPSDDELEYYLIEPADEAARNVGLQPQFLAVWAAFRHIGRLGLDALERAAAMRELMGAAPPTPRIAGLVVVEVQHDERELPAAQLLKELASIRGAQRRRGSLSIGGTLRRGK